MRSKGQFWIGEADDGLQRRLDAEISAYNAAVTGYHHSRMLSVAVRGLRKQLR